MGQFLPRWMEIQSETSFASKPSLPWVEESTAEREAAPLILRSPFDLSALKSRLCYLRSHGSRASMLFSFSD